ncbi:hypothetical protein KUTeg_021518 [Tegillarca granosa]|uniref:Uncharacterized protein n=1 Tax=Tegillarca granosa TaxID=220873 RepID=A0ABQ9E6Q7_TEGGR|nr:hypothetical protein KUTeg_021518 [Tegillarca granosa]
MSMLLIDQMLLTIMKLRQNINLANLFLISPQDVSVMFTNWIIFMFFQLSSTPIWPHRDIIIEHMPSKCKCDFPKTMIILDGTKMKVQRPSALNSQSQLYFDYKSATTLKGVIDVDPRLSITSRSRIAGYHETNA